MINWDKTRQISDDETRESIRDAKLNEFFLDMTELFVATNIPLGKLADQVFPRFLSKWCSKNCPDALTLRKASHYTKTS